MKMKGLNKESLNSRDLKRMTIMNAKSFMKELPGLESKFLKNVKEEFLKFPSPLKKIMKESSKNAEEIFS